MHSEILGVSGVGSEDGRGGCIVLNFDGIDTKVSIGIGSILSLCSSFF